MRFVLLLLVSGGCGPFGGARWDAEAECWEPRTAWWDVGPVSCSDMRIMARDRRGDCWAFGCTPAFPEGWTVVPDTCEELSDEAVDGWHGDGEEPVCE